MPHALPLVQGGTSYIAHLLNPRLSPVPPVTCTPLWTPNISRVQGAQGATGGVQKRVQGVHGVQPERSRVQACTPGHLSTLAVAVQFTMFLCMLGLSQHFRGDVFIGPRMLLYSVA